MLYQPASRYHLLPGLTYSAFSRPRREQPDGTYQIHLVKSQNPAYIPSDLEAWPIYYEAIQETLVNYPDAAIEAIRETRKKLAGLENLDSPTAPTIPRTSRAAPVGRASSPPKPPRLRQWTQPRSQRATCKTPQGMAVGARGPKGKACGKGVEVR